jgi:hypothetical protein
MLNKKQTNFRLPSVGVALGICFLACSVMEGKGGGSVRLPAAAPSEGDPVTSSPAATVLQFTETETPSPIPPTKTSSPTKAPPEIEYRKIKKPDLKFDQLIDLAELKAGGYFSFIGGNLDISKTDDTLSVFYISSDLKSGGQLFRIAQWMNFSSLGYVLYRESHHFFIEIGDYPNSQFMVLSFNLSDSQAYSIFTGSKPMQCRSPSQDRNDAEIIRLICSAEVDVLVQLSVKDNAVLSVQYFSGFYEYYRWVNNEVLMAASQDGGKSPREKFCLMDVYAKEEKCHEIEFHVEFVSDDMQWVVLSSLENSESSKVKEFSVVPLACLQADFPQLIGACTPVPVMEPEDLAPDDWMSTYAFAYAGDGKMIFGGKATGRGLVLWSFDVPARQMERLYSSDEYFSCDQWNTERKGFFCGPDDPSEHPVFISWEGDMITLPIKGIGLSEFFLP